MNMVMIFLEDFKFVNPPPKNVLGPGPGPVPGPGQGPGPVPVLVPVISGFDSWSRFFLFLLPMNGLGPGTGPGTNPGTVAWL